MGVIAIIFGFVTVIVLAGIIAEYKEKKLKIEAAIRTAELKHGYAPGTYSRSFSSKSAYKAMRRENKRWEKEMKKNGHLYADGDKMAEEDERAVLERGIQDLEERIRNLDTIMKEKQRKGE